MDLFIFLLFFFYFSSKSYFLDFIFLMLLMFFYFLLKGFDFSGFLFFYNLFSWGLILLSIFICSLMLISNMNFFYLIEVFNFSLSVFFMLLSLLMTFLSNNIFLFYLFFEFSVVPIFFIICGLGFNFERLESGFYMFFYTLTFSLPFLIFIVFIYEDLSVLDFSFSMFFYFSSFDYFFVWFSVFMFFVKVPSFFLHLWLPKAHVEAPVCGSMILAGLLLKLGVYGLMIYVSFVFFQIYEFSDLFFVWGVWGALVSSYICFRQVDLSKIIAYMSIMHMGMVISGLFSFFLFSYWGIYLMLLSHGLTSSVLFYSLNCFYERFFSRSLMLIKGSLMLIPGLFIWFCMCIIANISVPPSMGFFSELLLIFSVVGFVFDSSLFIFSLIFMSSVVSFYILICMFHGFNLSNFCFYSMNFSEKLVHFVHLVPLLSIMLII